MAKITRNARALLKLKHDKDAVVAYTDGSARPNPGHSGWGSHGYTFSPAKSDKATMVRTNTISNLGYVNKGDRLAKVAHPVTPNEYFDFFGSYEQKRTNNYSELNAVKKTLEYFKDHELSYIMFYCDSEYVINGISKGCEKYEASNWLRSDGSPIPNSDLLKDIWELVKHYGEKDVVIHFEWVKGHSGDIGNEQADSLAVLGMNYSKSGKVVNDFYIDNQRDYNRIEIVRHPFINYNRLYFNSVPDYNVEGHYFQANPGGSDFIVGTRTPDTGFSVVRLKEPDPIIEMIKERQYESSKEHNAIVMILLDQVYSRGVYKYLEAHDRHCLVKDNRNLNLNFIDGLPVTIEMNPAGLSLRALESFNILEEMLNNYLVCVHDGFDHKDNHIDLESHDITELFYEITENAKGDKKYTLRPEFIVGFRDMTVDVSVTHNGKSHDLTLPFILGMDTLPRNNLKRLEKDSPLINVITWKESEGSIRYASVVETNSAIGIWSNYFADRIFLKTEY